MHTFIYFWTSNASNPRWIQHLKEKQKEQMKQ